MNIVKNETAEKTNPVMDTARLTLSQLAAAGIKEAADCAKKLGLTNAMENYDVKKERITPLAVIQEMRFHFMNYYFRKSGCQNIVDVACGFSPRGLLAAREGYHYLGMDLQAAVSVMSQMAKELTDEEKLDGSFSYKIVDITDPAAMLEAVENINGKIVMGCEGLLVYLGRYEFESMLQGIASVLQRHGGYFITPDLVSAQFMFAVYTAILGEEEGKKALYALSASIQKKSDTTFKGAVTQVPMEEWETVFAKYGLQYELVPFLPDQAELKSFEQLTKEQITSIRQKTDSIRCLKLSALPKTAKRSFDSQQFSLSMEQYGASLHINLKGRLDSITAPDMLNKYESIKADGKIEHIMIDGRDLDYISSAGLRILLIMQKDLRDSKLLIHHVKRQVMEILEQTGFAEIFDVSER